MTRKNRSKKPSRDNLAVIHHFYSRIREGLLILMIALSVFSLLSLGTYHHSDPGWSHIVTQSHIANSGGKVGAWLADFLLYIFGYSAFVLPIMLTYAAWIFLRNRDLNIDNPILQISMILLRIIGFVLIFLGSAGLIELYLHAAATALPFDSGGIIGSIIGLALLKIFNEAGATLALITFILMGVTLFTGLSWMSLLEKIGSLVLNCAHRLFYFLKSYEWKERFDLFKDFRWIKLNVISEKLKGIFPSRPQEENQAEEKTDQSATLLASTMVNAPAIEKKPSIEEKISEAIHKKSNTQRMNVSPKLSLLDVPKQNKKNEIKKADLENRSREVEMRLADFGVQANVVAVHPGPVITRYELELAAGTKVSKVTNLAKDLARSFSVTSVRVVEVIPGKSVIGLELPNPHRLTVTLQEILSSSQYQNAHSWLTLGLGKDIAGHSVVVDLAKMPHLLVAGTTGSGKSVCLNVMLLSLLYKSSPAELRLILIDPKMLELSVYDGIPHLLTPVVTDMRDAASALRWCVMEMERRYRLMASLGVRNIGGYNAKVRQARERGKPLLNPLTVASEDKEQEELIEFPKIVVLADEFADMMVVVGKKVETLIARLAQKARAAGIHLILATQRPSVDVITGLIKANIPTRIAFQVSSKIDSRTILDQQGAEQLLGYGDMLYLPPGSGVPVRIHGAFVGDDEVHRVVKYLKQYGEPDYIEEVLDERTGTDYSGYVDAAVDASDAEQDPVYDEAVAFVVKARRVSVSSVQRRFKIGYNRAARIVEAMEMAGVVSKMEGNGSREVLAPATQE